MSKGMWQSTAGLYLTRWNPARPACLDNLILLTLDEADAHDAAVEAAQDGDASKESKYLEMLREREPDFVALVESKFRRVRREFGLEGEKFW